MEIAPATAIDPREFRNCLSRFATGVTVITTEVNGQVHGMTANGFMSVSLDPPLVLTSVANHARLNQLLPQSGRYGVSILHEDHENLSRHFAGRPVEGLVIAFVRKAGLPVLQGSVARLVARVVDVHPAGDHTLYIGRVEYLEANEAKPLLVFRGQYRTLDPEPQHARDAWLDDELFLLEPEGWNVGLHSVINAEKGYRPMSRHTLTTTALFTGADFLASLDDGREVWFDGERVKTITAHPAFRNSARSLAHLYDALHDPNLKEDLTLVDKFGITTHKFFAPSYSAQDLIAARQAIAIWQRMGYGWMGRTPDYKAAFMAQLAEGYNFYDPYGDNALNWYKKCAARCLFLNHVLIDPPVDRHRARIDVRDVYLSVDRDDDKGIYVSGAKMVATGSALTHATFVAVNSGTAARMEVGRDEDMALVFLIEMNAPGLKLITRPSYEYNAASPFDAPLASRFDENDAVMVFENAFVPWQNVLVYRDVEKSKGFYAQSGFFNRYNLQSAVRLAIKLEFCIGLLMKGTEAAGTSQFRGVETAIGELIGMRELIWSLTTAMVYDPEPGLGGTVVPRLQTAAASRIYTTRAWHRVREIFESILAGAPIYTVSSVRDMRTPELQPILDRYYRGTGLSGPKRIKLFKLVWDAMYSEFAGRHALYERNYAGNQEQHLLDALQWSQIRGDAARYRALVDQCLSDYDLDGWTVDYLTNKTHPTGTPD